MSCKCIEYKKRTSERHMILTGILGTWNMQSLYTSYNPHDDVEVHVVSSTGRFFCVLDALDFQQYYPYLPLYQTLPPPPCTYIGYSTVPYISRLLPILQIHIIIKIVSNDICTLTKCIFNLLFFQVTRFKGNDKLGFLWTIVLGSVPTYCCCWYTLDYSSTT